MNYKEDYWCTKEGKYIRICDMETKHIINTIKYLERHTDFYDVYSGDYDGFDYDDNSELVYRKIDELKYELDRRMKNAVEKKIVENYIKQEIYLLNKYGLDEEDSENLEFFKNLTQTDINNIVDTLADEYDDAIYETLRELIYERKGEK